MSLKNDPLSIIRLSIIEHGDRPLSPGLKAVEVTRSLERAGYTIVNTDVVAALAVVAQHMGADAWQWWQLVTRLGLGKMVPYDPAKHDAMGFLIEPGQDFLEYSDVMREAMKQAAPVLRGELH
jgi:hypothetical protein